MILIGFWLSKFLDSLRMELLAPSLAMAITLPSFAAVTFTTQHGETVDAFDHLLSSSDLIHGKQIGDVDVFENPSDNFGNPSVPGWHPANNVDPLDQLPALTDGVGMRASGLTGLLNDNYPDEGRSGRPAKIVQYPFDAPVDIGRINILTGNRNNGDSRIFSSTYIEYSTDNGFTFHGLGYFQSDPSGTINEETNPSSTFIPAQKSTFLSIFDGTSTTMLTGVTDIIFNFYSVGAAIGAESPLRGVLGDQWDGINPFTGIDDELPPAFVSPLVLEIDVLAPSEGPDGDFNMDGKVDIADYVFWRKNDGTQPGYDAWRAHFGDAAPGSGGVGVLAVPEPQTLALVMAVITLTVTLRARIGS
jgi:hypothetical protein